MLLPPFCMYRIYSTIGTLEGVAYESHIERASVSLVSLDSRSANTLALLKIRIHIPQSVWTMKNPSSSKRPTKPDPPKRRDRFASSFLSANSG